MKRKLIIILPIIIILIISLFLLLYPTIKNNNYQKELISNIYNNTELKNITYLNKDNNYYIAKTNDRVVVFDLNYEEKLNLELSSLKESNLDLVYRRNNLYYEEKIREDKKLIYKFYNIHNLELVYETRVGGS